jgi:hypothetical protein
MSYAKQGKVKKTVIRYIYEEDCDLVRVENETSKGYHITGYINLKDIDGAWNFAAKGGEELVDMTAKEIIECDAKAIAWTNANVKKWRR